MQLSYQQLLSFLGNFHFTLILKSIDEDWFKIIGIERFFYLIHKNH